MGAITKLFSIKPKRELKELYIFLFFFSFAGSLVSIFEPIFLWKLGFGLSGVALYYALHYSLYVLAMPLGARFAARFGFEKSIALATPILIVHFLVLSRLEVNLNLYWVAPFVSALFKIFFWPAFHANFATFSNSKNNGTEQSWVRLVTFLSGILGPVVGGIVAARFGFSALFIIAAASLVVAVLVMLRTNEEFKDVKFKYSDPWRLLVKNRHRRMVAAMLGWGENLIHLAFWPVFLFVVFENTAVLGLVISIVVGVSMVLGFGIGELTDRVGARKVLRYAAPALSLTYLARIFLVFSPLTAGLAAGYNHIAQFSYNIPFQSRLYQNGKRTGNPLLYVTSFELALAVVKGMLCWALFVVFFFGLVSTAAAWPFLWTIAAIFALLYAVL